MAIILLWPIIGLTPLYCGLLVLLSLGALQLHHMGLCVEITALGASADHLRQTLVFLRVLISLFILIRVQPNNPRAVSLMLLTIGLLLVLVLSFFRSSLLIFYIAFEASLIPISLIVFGWGYQPERLRAAISMILYTIVASLPLLLIIVTLR